MKIFKSIALLFGLMACSGAAEDPTSYFNAVDTTAYLDWLSSIVGRYDASVYLPSPSTTENGVALHWTLDDNHIVLGVAARATGWLGFGISEAGGMKGSDMVIFESATNELFDAHVLDDVNTGPIPDGCQNWLLKSSHVGGGFIIFEATRLLDTGDSFDRAIVNDDDLFVAPHRVIAAWGESDRVSYHGIDNRVRSSIRFHRTGVDEMAEFQAGMDREAEGSFELRAVDYPVKPIDTEYAKFCFSQTDLIELGMPADTDLHVVGIEPVIDQDSKGHVHHFVLFASENTNEGGNGTQEACDAVAQDETAYSWAPGEGPFTLPLNVGGPLGTGGFQSYQLEIHYDNPSLVTGVLDSSSVRMFFTSKKREFDLGILELADGDIALVGQSVIGDSASGYAQHTFECPDSCSSVSVSEPLVAIRETFHMHGTGRRGSNEQIRDGKVIRTGAVDFFDMEQQGDMVIQQEPFEIQPGDSFRTSCYFQSNEEEVWGAATQDEMCMVSVYYYPRQVAFDLFPFTCIMGIGLDECEPIHKRQSLTDVNDLTRSFGSSGGACLTPGAASGVESTDADEEASLATTTAPTDTSGGGYGALAFYEKVTIGSALALAVAAAPMLV